MSKLTRLKAPILLTFTLAFHFASHANTSQSAQNVWQIKPKVCLVEKLGQTCEIRLNLSIDSDLYLADKPALHTNQYCLFLENAKLLCFSVVDNKFVKNSANNSASSDLKLQTSANQTMLLEALEVYEIEQGLSIKLNINKESEVTIQNAQSQIVHSQILKIKARKASNKTRRLREPWSLF